MGITIALSVILAVTIFMVLPFYASLFFQKLISYHKKKKACAASLMLSGTGFDIFHGQIHSMFQAVNTLMFRAMIHKYPADNYAVAVRKPDHEIIVETRTYHGICKNETLRNFLIGNFNEIFYKD